MTDITLMRTPQGYLVPADQQSAEQIAKLKSECAGRKRSWLFKLRSYNAWRSMKDRCKNKNHQYFHIYGGAGISVCERWMDFVNFLQDMGEPTNKKMSIDRIDTKGNYEPSNCRWATHSQQCANRRGWGKSEFKGVYKTPSGRFMATINHDGKQICLGTFDSGEEAARVFDKAQKQRHGDFALSNEKAGAFKNG